MTAANCYVKNVLLVDDSDVDLYIAKKIIEKDNFAENIETKNSAAAALQFISENESTPEKLPDIIFLDIRMPDIDGFGFLEQFEKTSETMRQNCRIAMLTSSQDPNDIERAKKFKNVFKFIGKPLSFDVLKEIKGVA